MRRTDIKLGEEYAYRTQSYQGSEMRGKVTDGPRKLTHEERTSERGWIRNTDTYYVWFQRLNEETGEPLNWPSGTYREDQPIIDRVRTSWVADPWEIYSEVQRKRDEHAREQREILAAKEAATEAKGDEIRRLKAHLEQEYGLSFETLTLASGKAAHDNRPFSTSIGERITLSFDEFTKLLMFAFSPREVDEAERAGKHAAVR